MSDHYGLEGSDVESMLKMVLMRLDAIDRRLSSVEETLMRAQGTIDKFTGEVVPVLDGLLPLVDDMMRMPLLKALMPKKTRLDRRKEIIP